MLPLEARPLCLSSLYGSLRISTDLCMAVLDKHCVSIVALREKKHQLAEPCVLDGTLQKELHGLACLSYYKQMSTTEMSIE